jgi:hypothetical protein
MAVADVALALGPRNRRRLTRSAVTVVGIAAVVAVVLVTHPANHSGTSSSAGSARVSGRASSVTDKLVFGMTKGQVLGRVGEPTTRVGACWQYRENLEIRGGLDKLNAERVCFLGGNYSYSYPEIDGKWYSP